MQIFSFTIYCKEANITEEQIDTLYELAEQKKSGILCGVQSGEVYVSFDIEGTFEEPVIKQSLEQVKSVGLTPDRVVDDGGLNERKY